MEGPDFSQETIRQAKLLADTDAGKRLKALLSQGNAQGLKKAMEQASQGNMAAAKRTIEAFLETPEAEQLLAQLREKP